MTQLVVFTDLDGTLLDHYSYSHAAALPALARLAGLGVPVVLASSKTAAEIAPLHEALQLGDAPALVENGAGILMPGRPLAQGDAYERLRAGLAALPPELRAGFVGFGDMSAAEVAACTGLSPEAAALAKIRVFSEPGLWTGDAAGQGAFADALAAQGITARHGGRFLTLSFGRTKADAMAEVAGLLDAGQTLALGDAPNDIEMLEAADFGIIVTNPEGPGLPALAGEATGRITRSAAPGPQGWNESVQAFLDAQGYKG